MTSEPLQRLGCFLYRSTAVEGLGDGDLRDILREARARNQDSLLTGCLHYEDGLFFQWLEGPTATLEPVIQLILNDPRHCDITVLGRGPLDHRRFQQWRMRFSDRLDGSLMDWIAQGTVSTVDRNAYAGGITAFLQAVSI